jgi:hypothetical protein
MILKLFQFSKGMALSESSLKVVLIYSASRNQYVDVVGNTKKTNAISRGG